ncbi:MAG: stage II sporulation protein M [Gammaproteobacteria bacterium]|nr:stage II sporulation protein M [Gammaproteobacteria bacterium]
MRQQEFEDKYRGQWQAFHALLDKMSGSHKTQLSHKELSLFPTQYRNICHSLAIAKERQYSPYLVDHLDTLVLRGHQLFYNKRQRIGRRIFEYIAHGFAREIQNNRGLFLLSHAIFYGPALIIFALTLLNPDLIYSLLPHDQVASFESMYNPEQTVLGRERESDTDFYMFGHYIRNNIGIGFQTFATGILFTLGTLFFLIFNGIFFGVIAAHIINIKYQSTFFSFVIGHGSVELTAIVIAGMAGIKLGWALIAPGNFSRLDALKLSAQKAVQLMYGVFFFLLLAAFIEAFWSSSTTISNTVKYIVGASLWTLVYSYLLWPRSKV